MDMIAKKYNITKPFEWGRITSGNIHEAGGGSFLYYYYNNSTFTALQSIYKGTVIARFYCSDINWKREWFHVPRFSPTYWNSRDNTISFLDSIAKETNITSLTDWRRITVTFIKSKGGFVRNFGFD